MQMLQTCAKFAYIVDLRINEILPIGEVENLAYRGAKAVRNRTYRPR